MAQIKHRLWNSSSNTEGVSVVKSDWHGQIGKEQVERSQMAMGWLMDNLPP